MTASLITALTAGCLVALIALVFDLRTRRIPNMLTIGAFASALLFHVVTAGYDGLLDALTGCAVGFSLLLLMWLCGASGAGDVKLMGALGAWLGATPILFVFFGSAVVTLLMMPIGALRARLVNPSGYTLACTSAAESLDSDRPARHIVPYAVPVAVATCAMVGLRLLNVWN